MKNNNFSGIEIFSTGKFIIFLYCKYYENKNDILKNSTYTFSHIHNTIADFEKLKLITLNKVGRKNIITLTKEGEKIHSYLLNINNEIIKLLEEKKNE